MTIYGKLTMNLFRLNKPYQKKLLYLCTGSFQSYQERQRDTPIEALATHEGIKNSEC